MAKVNQLAKYAKKLEALQVKAEKLAAEIKEIAGMAAKEAATPPAPEPAAKKPAAPAAKKPAATTDAKKRGRPKAGK